MTPVQQHTPHTRCLAPDAMAPLEGYPKRQRTRQGVVLLLMCFQAACHAERITTEDPARPTFDAHVWTGGTLQLASTAFDTSDSIRILLGGTPLPVQRLDSVTLVATLPETTGTFEVGWESRGRVHQGGEVTLHGRLLANRRAPLVDGTAMAWPYGAGTFLAGVGGRLVLVDVFDGGLTPMFADSLYTRSCGFGPWPAGGNAVVLAGPVPGRSPTADYCRARVVRGSDGVVIDSFPLYDRSVWWPTVRLADGSWVVNAKRAGTLLYQKIPGGPYGGFTLQTTYALGETWRMVGSPDGVYAFPAVGVGDSTGLPIFRGDRLASLAAVHRVTYSEAAAFSESGDTLAVLQYQGDTLFVVASRNGDVLAAVPATATYTDLAFDSGRPWLYAASADSGGSGVTVAVYDLRTMRVATTLHARSLTGGLGHPEVYLAVDVWHRRLDVYLTDDSWFTNPGAGFSFDLMP
jgi:hypothetical protein